MILEILVLLLLSTSIAIAGQIFYKKALSKIKTDTYLDFIKTALGSYKIWIGFCCIATGIAIWMMALSQGDLNFIKSLDSMQYILLLFAARIFLSEKIDKNKLLGTLFVAFGIILVVIS